MTYNIPLPNFTIQPKSYHTGYQFIGVSQYKSTSQNPFCLRRDASTRTRNDKTIHLILLFVFPEIQTSQACCMSVSVSENVKRATLYHLTPSSTCILTESS
ncbi:hypothetical protein VTJ04DRAFT_4803 [Mycothermus thermophilus]|uniref:uncharacterized protein n=1 Tax=Humicola insolens TaxID=85995 RepID=UPI003743BE9A